MPLSENQIIPELKFVQGKAGAILRGYPGPVEDVRCLFYAAPRARCCARLSAFLARVSASARHMDADIVEQRSAGGRDHKVVKYSHRFFPLPDLLSTKTHVYERVGVFST